MSAPCKTPLLSVIIVNHNGGEYLSECIESIGRNIPCDHEIVLVDNCSTDGSPERVKKDYPFVRLIESVKNLGFAGGNNLGARYARGRYILLLNQDTELLSDITPALELFEKDEYCGIVGVRMLGGDGSYRHSAGLFPTPLKLARFTWLYLKSGNFSDGDFPPVPGPASYPVQWVEGSFMLIRKSLWDRTEGLDEGYFMYGEDVDLCKTISMMGYKTLYCPDVSYRHYGSFDSARVPLLVRGFARFIKKFEPAHVRMISYAMLYAGITARLALCGIVFLHTGMKDRTMIDAYLNCFRA